MTEESELALEADPKPVADAQVQTEGQPEAEDRPEGEEAAAEEAEKKSPAKERRERQKAALQRAREEADTWRRKAEEADAKLAKLQTPRKAPTPQEFPEYDDLIAAKAGHQAVEMLTERERADVKALAEEARNQAAQAQQAEKAALAAAWREQVDEARGRYADFDAVLQAAIIPDAVADIILRTDDAADVAYHLGRNPKQAAEIARMTPIEAARAIGRIEASLAAPKPRTETKAPAPISPVGGRAAAAIDPSRLSYEEYKAARKAGQIR